MGWREEPAWQRGGCFAASLFAAAVSTPCPPERAGPPGSDERRTRAKIDTNSGAAGLCAVCGHTVPLLALRRKTAGSQAPCGGGYRHVRFDPGPGEGRGPFHRAEAHRRRFAARHTVCCARANISCRERQLFGVALEPGSRGYKLDAKKLSG